MIREVTKYEIVCDGCGAFISLNGREVTCDSRKDAELLAADIWTEQDGKHFCQDCQPTLKTGKKK